MSSLRQNMNEYGQVSPLVSPHHIVAPIVRPSYPGYHSNLYFHSGKYTFRCGNVYDFRRKSICESAISLLDIRRVARSQRARSTNDELVTERSDQMTVLSWKAGANDTSLSRWAAGGTVKSCSGNRFRQAQPLHSGRVARFAGCAQCVAPTGAGWRADRSARRSNSMKCWWRICDQRNSRP